MQKEETQTMELDKAEAGAALQRVCAGCKPHFKQATSNSLGCLLTDKAGNKAKGEGWPRCKVGGARKEHYLHHLALVSAGRREELRGLEKGEQASHLCHHRNCFNPDHIVVEEAEKNRVRNKCRGWSWLVCPCGCNHKFNPCTHTPQCLLPQNSPSDCQ